MPDSKQQRTSYVSWNGSLHEQLDLMAAVEHNCECAYDAMGRRRTACSSHTMIAHDQRALDGLLWNRRLVKQLLAGEWTSRA